MSRTGSFGRQPRAAQSLTNTVVAIAREFQNQRAQNIMDAWQKGGLFEGKKATDSVVLKFWKDKSDGVSKDDPLYDTYTNTVKQLDYTIHESKMTAQYAQHKTTDAAMVSFYLGWAKKVPKDSEFYRVLQRDAGQYMRNAQAGQAARAAQAKELNYQKQQAATQQHYEAGAAYIMDTLRRVAQSGVSGAGIGPLIAPSTDGFGSNDTSVTGEDFTNFDAGGNDPNTGQRIASDPEVMLRLLQVIDPIGQRRVGGPDEVVSTGVGRGTDAVIYHTDAGVAVTGKDIIDKLSKLDPTFKGDTPLDIQHISNLLDRQVQGLNERIARANKTGHPADAASLQKSKSYVSMLNRQVAAWPIEKSYAALRETFDDVANDPTASPQAVLKAHEAYVAGLVGLANDPTIRADDNLKARIMAEANGQAGMPTLHESFSGMAGGSYDPASAKDSANTAAHMQFLQDQVDSVDGQPGSPVWTLGKTVNGKFTPDPTGREIGAAQQSDIDAAGAPGSGTFVTLPDPNGKGSITLRVTGTPIKAVAHGPDGTPIPATNGLPIGFAYTLPNGSATDIQYGFKGPDGSLVVSKNPPYDAKYNLSASSTGGNHFEVDLSDRLPVLANPNDPNAGAIDSSKVNLMVQGDIAGMPGWSVQDVGKPTTAHPKGTPGTLTFNPYLAATATDDRPAGGIDPNTDFHSLTLSHLMSTPEGVTVLQNLDSNPAFKDQLTSDAYSYAGAQKDANGAWVPGTGDQAKLQAANNTILATGVIKDVTDWVANQMSKWQRTNTTPFHGNDTAPGPNGLRVVAPGATADSTMPADLTKGTPFEAAGAAFDRNTANLKAPPLEDRQQFMLNIGHAIKTPNVAPAIQSVSFVANQAGTVAAGTKAIPQPTQTGSQAPGATTSQGATQTGSTAPQPTHNPNAY